MRKRHSLKYFFLVTTFCISIYNTYLIAKLRWKIDLEINWFMETPLHGHKGGDHSGLWAPKEKNYLEKYGFCCYWRPSSVRKILSFFSYCLQCHKKLLKVAIISNNQLLRFFCAYKQAGIVHQQLYIQHTPRRLSFGNWVYKSHIFELAIFLSNRGEQWQNKSRRGNYQRSFETTVSQDLLSFCNMHGRTSEPEGGRGGGRATRQSFIPGNYSQGSNPLPFSIPS